MDTRDRDILLYDCTSSGAFAWLRQWATSVGLSVVPDFHRLQMEHWLWTHRDRLAGDLVLDVGVIDRKPWAGPGYRTFGLGGCDITGDLRAMPFEEGSVDAVLCTEVLEHCEDPFQAMREIRRVLKPGGLLLVTSPFLWPWHGTHDYRDFWRFTHQGWELLLAGWQDVRITPCTMTPEGEAAYDMLRRFECLGYRSTTTISTGYLCEATR